MLLRDREFKEEQEKGQKLQAKILSTMNEITINQQELEKLEESDDQIEEIDQMEEEDDNTVEIKQHQKEQKKELTPNEIKIQKMQEISKKMAVMKRIQETIDSKVSGDIETICSKVIESHVERITKEVEETDLIQISGGKTHRTVPVNMNYIVKHGNKQAIFKLTNMNDTIKNIKSNIGEYFGLPPPIFLENQNKEILLDRNKVIDELFPMQSSKIRGEDPVIYVTFQKNMTTLDYILGDQREIRAMKKQLEDQEKERRDNEEKVRK